jgi:hypothetical protein
VITAPRVRWLLYAVGALLVAGLAAGAASALDPGGGRLFLILPGGIAVLSGALALMARNPGELRLTGDGFFFRGLLASGSYRWGDVARFGVYLGVGGDRVGFDFGPEYGGPRPRKLVAEARGGFDASLPGTFGRDATALANLLERWRIAARQPARPA